MRLGLGGVRNRRVRDRFGYGSQLRYFQSEGEGDRTIYCREFVTGNS